MKVTEVKHLYKCTWEKCRLYDEIQESSWSPTAYVQENWGTKCCEACGSVLFYKGVKVIDEQKV
jgi:hypothetical protein